MKKRIVLIILISLIAGAAWAWKPFQLLFTGKWQPAEHPMLIEQEGAIAGYQDIQNMRRRGNRLVGVLGHSKGSSNVDSSGAYIQINDMVGFVKEGYEYKGLLFVKATDGGSQEKIFSCTASVACNAISGVLSNPPGRMAPAPQGYLAYASSGNLYIYGGDTTRVGAVLTSTTIPTVATLTNPIDVTPQMVDNNIATTTALNATSSNVLLVGSPVKLSGIKVYNSANASNASFTVKEFRAAGWTAASGVTDNTTGLQLTGGKTITWTYSDNAEILYMEGYALYWYSFVLNHGSSNLYTVRGISDGSTKFANIWDGSESPPVSVKKYDTSTYTEYTDEASTDDQAFVVNLDALNTTHSLYLGFLDHQQGFNVRMLATKENSTATVLTVKYWNGTAWAAVNNLTDGTSESSTSLYKTGVISFSGMTDSTEFKKSLSGEEPVYYYQLTFSVQLDAEVEAYYITGIPAPEAITGYEFPAMYRNRLFWFNDEAGAERNKAVYSAMDAPYVYNGADAGELYFGDSSPIIAAAEIYNVFQQTGVYQLIVAKQHSMYRLTGATPETFEIQQITDNIGCVAPLTMRSCGPVGEGSESRNVLIWQGDSGVYMSDGAAVVKISDDIEKYFDPNSAEAIWVYNSFGICDTELNVYKLLVTSPSAGGIINTELEYDLKTGSWTRLSRQDASGNRPAQAGAMLSDIYGKRVLYLGMYNGRVYSDNDDDNWKATAMTQYVHTKDLLVDDEAAWFKKTTIRSIRLGFTDKNNATASENVAITHYCDGVAAVAGVNNQYPWREVNLATGPFATQDVRLGPCSRHSFKISHTTASGGAGNAYGLELIGMGLYYDTQQRVEVE